MAAPLVRRYTTLAAKHETTVGTAIAVTASDATMRVFNLRMFPQIDFQEREGESNFDRIAGTLKGYLGRAQFSVDVCGGASVPSWASVFLPACGLKNTAGVFTPDILPPEASGSGTKTLTIRGWVGNFCRQIHGAMGNVTFRFISAERIMADFDFLGVWDDPSDVSIITPTYTTTAPLTFRSAGLTVGSITPKFSQMTINLNNVLTPREDENNAAGYHSVLITDRNIGGTFNPEANLVADDDVFGRWKAGTEAALGFAVGTSGNRITVAAPKLQLMNVQPGTEDLLRNEQTFQCGRSTTLGGDALSITLD